MAANATYGKDGDGGTFIPASQRPDGTWRKPRRVKDGYVPQEEVPLYESKGKQFAARKPTCPVGLTAEILAEMKAEALKEKSRSSTVPNVSSEDKTKKKKKKKSAAENIVESLAKTSIGSLNETTKTSTNNTSLSPVASADPGRRLKSLKKKLREIEILEQKISLGELPKPDRDQVEKLSKKQEITTEIAALESN